MNINHDDNRSCSSSDAIDELLKESEIQEFDMSLEDLDKDHMDDLLEPIPDIEHHNHAQVFRDYSTDIASPSFHELFSPAEELSKLQQLERNTTSTTINKRKQVSFADKDDVSSLLTSDLIEDQPYSANHTSAAETSATAATFLEDDVASPVPNKKMKHQYTDNSAQPRIVSPPHSRTTMTQEKAATRGISLGTEDSHQQTSPTIIRVPDVVVRIMNYLYYAEADRDLYVQADHLVRECYYYHTCGKHKYRSLPGSIFEGLVHLLGGPRFNEIYHSAQTFVVPPTPPTVQQQPQPQHHRLNATAHTVKKGGDLQRPSEVEVAIAYGVHLARQEQQRAKSPEEEDEGPSETPMEMIQDGAKKLASMKDSERILFWNYMMDQQSHQ